MKKIFGLIVSCALFFLLFSSIICAEIPPVSEADKSLFEDKCSYCHSIERPLSKKKNMEQWTKTVKRMQRAKLNFISDAEAEKIIAYLISVRGEEAQVINKIKDPANVSELEKEHVPVIQVGAVDAEKKTVTVTVKVGEIQHPMEETHYIKYIELFIDNKSAGKVELKAGDNPEAKFDVTDVAGKQIIARAECNVHGLWEGGVK